jgi:uncharacterized protein YndB with AHSA1/START domain
MTDASVMTDELVKFHTLSDSAIRAEIELKAAPERVYAAWTRPERLLKWFGPRAGGSLEVDHFDCSVGGRYDVIMVFADGDRVPFVGKYLELDPPKKIVFTWQWTEGPTISSETLVTVDLAPSDVGTHLTLTHERFASAEARDSHREGWEPLLSRLASILNG